MPVLEIGLSDVVVAVELLRFAGRLPLVRLDEAMRLLESGEASKILLTVKE